MHLSACVHLPSILATVKAKEEQDEEKDEEELLEQGARK